MTKKMLSEQQGLSRCTNGVYDSRADLGYGTTNPKFQIPRQNVDSFPYVEDDVCDDVDIDDETLAAVGEKSPAYQPADFYGAAGVNPFYFAGGNTKLSDCFSRPAKVMLEINAYKNSLVPIPGLYKGMEAGVGGTGASFSPSDSSVLTTRRGTGTTYGWSKAPYETDDAEDIDGVDDSQIFTIRDVYKKMFADRGESL